MFKLNSNNKIIEHLLDKLEDKELKIYYNYLKKSNIKLDKLEYKKITSNKILNPVKKMPVEWWYFTGHLKDENNNDYGFEYCFFKFHPQSLRIGPLPLSLIKKKPFLVLHFAITDIKNNKYYTFQESGLIHKNKINYNELSLNLNKSQLILENKIKNKFPRFKIKNKNKKTSINLDLKPIKKLIKHYKTGYLKMYNKPIHKTYYLSFPRIKTKGTIIINNKELKVSGESWFDHQKLNMPHKSPVLGWDWFSIMLDNKTEIMFFTLRDKKGLNHKHMGGTLIKENSKTIDLKQEDVKIINTKTWTSEKTKITYPSEWIFKINKLNLELKIIPTISNQEFNGKITTQIIYWEGSCNVINNKTQKNIGKAYIELAGYDKRLITKIMKINYD